MEHIRHIFFDLDKTLWDFETNSREALLELYGTYKLEETIQVGFEEFYHRFAFHNEYCWDLYRRNRMKKKVLRYERFYLTFKAFGVQNKPLSKSIGEAYVEISPKKTALIPFTQEVLEYLFPQYRLHIITNGFEEVQGTKLKTSGIDHYFGEIITSEKAGRRKPDPKIFSYALSRTGGSADTSLVIGDDWDADIMGAKNSGFSAIWFNPRGEAAENIHSISCLSELKDML